MNVHIIDKEAARVVSTKQHKNDKHHITLWDLFKTKNFIRITIHCFKTFHDKIKMVMTLTDTWEDEMNIVLRL